MSSSLDPSVQSMLVELKDIHLPPPPAVWPLAPGWYVIIILSLLGLLYVCWWGMRQSRRWRMKRVARRRVQMILTEHERLQDSAQAFADLSVLLRRAALVFAGRRVAGLTGEAWLDFLDEGGKTQAFRQGVGRLLLHEPYQKMPDPKAIRELAQLIEQWIRRQD